MARNKYGVTIEALVAGDVITVSPGHDVEVVSVIDADGARGGIVDTKPIGGKHSKTSGFVLGDEITRVVSMATPAQSKLEALVERNGLFGGGSVAFGAAVSLKQGGDVAGYFLGTIVDMTDDRKSVWIRRIDDEPGTAVLYSVKDLELASNDDLVAIARVFLARQYREAAELRSAARKAAAK